MKLLLVLALGLAAPLAANADVFVKGSVGHQFKTDKTEVFQENTLGEYQKQRLTTQAAIGYNITDKTSVQVDYTNVNQDVKQENYALTVNHTIASPTNFSVYGIGSVGYDKVKLKELVDTKRSVEGVIVGLGAGINYPISTSTSLFTEGQVHYNTEHNYYQPRALVGVKFNTFAF